MEDPGMRRNRRTEARPDSNGSSAGPPGGPGMPGGMGARGGMGASPLRSRAGIKRTFESLGHAGYRNLWIGLMLQMGAMQMQMLARGYFVYELTGSPALLGVVTAAAAIPALIFGLFGGVLADRVEKKKIIQAGQVISVLLALFVAVSITTGTVTWQHLLVASVVQGTVMPLMMPARQAIIPQLVGRERMMNAVALNSMAMSLTTMVAPALAGGIISGIGIGATYYLIAGMNVLAIVFTQLLPRLQAGAARPARSPLGDLADGLRYVRANGTLVMLLLLGFSTMVLAMPIRFILPIFARDVFEVGSSGLGGMMSLMGLGSLGGALAIASAGKLARRGFLLAAAGLVSGAFLLGFAAVSEFAPMYYAGLVFMALIGMVQSARMTLNNSLMMEYSAEEYRGRVMGLFTLNMAIMPAGVLPITFAVEAIGAPGALAIMASALMLISGAVLVGSRALRRLE